jgi:hypothetical protein
VKLNLEMRTWYYAKDEAEQRLRPFVAVQMPLPTHTVEHVLCIFMSLKLVKVADAANVGEAGHPDVACTKQLLAFCKRFLS